jgi:uncharacterized protein (DUF2236 family)
MTITIIRQEDLEQQLALVKEHAAGQLAGLYGPRAMTWRINREAALFLGAGRALLLQLAHPWIAAAIADHSRTMMDPIGRFHRTFSTMFSIVFGTLDQALGAARRLHQRHAQIVGALTDSAGPFPKGSSYFANELSALRWVSATLTDTALLAHDLVLPPLTDDERERYYAESKLCAGLFGIPGAALPPDWAAFGAYNENMWHSDTLSVTPAARVIADQILGDATRWLRVPTWYVRLTAHLLPPPLREAFGLPYGRIDQEATMRALRRLRRAYPLIPGNLRYVGPYHEASGRLSGRLKPNIITRALNRIWIGHPGLI